MEKNAESERKREMDEWWNKFEAAKSTQERADLVMEACRLGRSEKYYEELDLLTASLDYISAEWGDEAGMEKYCALLEEMMRLCPAAFANGAEYHVQSLVYWGIFKGDEDQVKRAAAYLAAHPQENADLVLSVLDAMLFAGFSKEALDIALAHVKPFKEGKGILPGACSDLSDMAFPILCQMFSNSGSIDRVGLEAMNSKFCSKLNEDFETYPATRVKIVFDKDYAYRKWSSGDFAGKSREAGEYLLCTEFIKQLMYLLDLDLARAWFLDFLKKELFMAAGTGIFEIDAEEAWDYLRSFDLPMRTARSIMTVYSAMLYYDFLRARGIISDALYKRSMEDLACMKMRLSLGTKWEYAFVDRLFGNHDRFLPFLESARETVGAECKNSRPFLLPPLSRAAKPEAGRNEPCPCGSGKKYKKCCLRR